MRYIGSIILILVVYSCNESRSEITETLIIYPGTDTCFKVGAQKENKFLMLDDIEIIENTFNDITVVNNAIIQPGQTFKFFQGYSKDHLFEYEICCKTNSNVGRLVIRYVLTKNVP